MTDENWRTIPDYPDYSVSDCGRVMRTKKPKSGLGSAGALISQHPNTHGYWTVRLCRNSVCKTVVVHRLVAKVFELPKNPDQIFVAHNDGSRTNNHISNLRWATPKENTADKIVHGTHQIGEKNHRSRLTEGDVRVIRSLRGLGESVASVSQLFGISKGMVSHICNGNAWKHVA